MNKLQNVNYESGQAIAEMCIAMVAIMAVFLGLIFIGGLGISNIQALIRSKSNVENYSRSPNPAGNSGENIYAWDYGKSQAGGDGLAFTADDRAIANAAANTDGVILADEARTLFSAQLENSQNSQSLIDGSYVFMPTSNLGDYVKGNYARDLPEMFLESANLTSSNGAPDTAIYTLSPRQFSPQELARMKKTFADLFGVNADRIDLQNMRANNVYMPVQPQATP